jgi:hypothetical protein
MIVQQSILFDDLELSDIEKIKYYFGSINCESGSSEKSIIVKVFCNDTDRCVLEDYQIRTLRNKYKIEIPDEYLLNKKYKSIKYNYSLLTRHFIGGDLFKTNREDVNNEEDGILRIENIYNRTKSLFDDVFYGKYFFLGRSGFGKTSETIVTLEKDEINKPLNKTK